MQKLADLTHAAAEAPAVTEPLLGSVTQQGGEQAFAACSVLGCAGWTPLQTAAAAAQQAPVEVSGEAAQQASVEVICEAAEQAPVEVSGEASADAADEGAAAALPCWFALHAAFLPACPALLALPCPCPCPCSVCCQHRPGTAAVVDELWAHPCWFVQPQARFEVNVM